jgi:shikimate kinase
MNFIVIAGPPAVGKMTVGQALAQKMDYKLFHNHMSIELTIQFFDFGEAGFQAINEGIRKLVFETVSNSKSLKGFIFTVMLAFDLQEDLDYLEDLRKQFGEKGWTFYFVELFATLEKRLERNPTPNRLAHKASKRDVEASNKRLVYHHNKYQLNSKAGEIKEENYLRIDNTDKSPEEVADEIIHHFNWVTEAKI